MTRTLLTCSLLAACGSSPTAAPDTTSVTADAAPFTAGVSTLAGAAETGSADGDRATARFSNPVNVARGPDGTTYVADFDNGAVRTIDTSGNVATLIAQTGFARPFGFAFAADGTLFVSTDNDPHGNPGTTTGTIWRIAGHTATVVATGLGRVRGLVGLPDGRLAMADDAHHVIQLLEPSTGAITLLAGTWDAAGWVDAAGAAARFTRPYGLAQRADGMLVVTDFGNQRLRLVELATGATTTFAGSGVAGYTDGALADARFGSPQGIAIDAAGDVFVTDLDNYRIRRIRGTTVDTIAGNGTAGYVDADDPMTAELYGIEGLAVSADGTTLVVADGSRGEPVPYNRIRQIAVR